MLIAEIKGNDNHWFVEGRTRTEEFELIVGAIGYGDPSEEGDYGLDAVCIVGLQIDKRLNVLGEFIGTFEECAKEAINFKDRFLLKRILIDFAYESNRRALLKKDGLTKYEPRHMWRGVVKSYVHDASYWPHFRDRKYLASLVPVDELILAEWDSSVLRTHALFKRGEALAVDSIVKVRNLTREDYKKGKDHPLNKALVYCCTYLERYQHSGRQTTAKPTVKHVTRWS